MNILITGSNGYLGSNLVNLLKNNYNLFLLNRNVLDLLDLKSLMNWMKDKFFDVVIHTAIKGGSRLQSDSSSIIDTNLQMYLNLLECRESYKKFINIGSGAEVYAYLTPYGLSKRAIYESIQDKDSFYSLRIFGLFNQQELATRFIKANLFRYIKKEKMLIHKDRLMDFIYFEDFAKIIELYINQTNLPKNIDCVYSNKYFLSDICNIINKLSNYSVPIEFKESFGVDSSYIGEYNELGIPMLGLEAGISQTYKDLLEHHE